MKVIYFIPRRIIALFLILFGSFMNIYTKQSAYWIIIGWGLGMLI